MHKREKSQLTFSDLHYKHQSNLHRIPEGTLGEPSLEPTREPSGDGEHTGEVDVHFCWITKEPYEVTNEGPLKVTLAEAVWQPLCTFKGTTSGTFMKVPLDKQHHCPAKQLLFYCYL